MIDWLSPVSNYCTACYIRIDDGGAVCPRCGRKTIDWGLHKFFQKELPYWLKLLTGFVGFVILLWMFYGFCEVLVGLIFYV